VLIADSESYQTCSERREQHAKMNYPSAGWWPTALPCNLGVMLGAADLGVVQAEKSEQQGQDAYTTQKPTLSLFHFDWAILMQCVYRCAVER